MKLTEFLKKYSLINTKFINDFYSFYDEGKNEYDFTINITLLAQWLKVRKDQLKRLLISNYIEDKDYIIIKKKIMNAGIGSNNTKHVLLTYNCAKMLCMISRSDKATIIREYYIDLEKLIIKYKDEIVDSLNRQLGIKQSNKKIIEHNKDTALIYILKTENDTNEGFKIGNSGDLKKRMKQYNVGRLSELPIVFVYKTDYMKDIEQCMKDNLKKYQLKSNTEIFDIDLEFIKETIKYCNIKNATLLKKNTKLYNAKDNKRWLIFIDRENINNTDELYKEIKVYQKKSVKKSSKKLSKKPAKKIIKKLTKKSSKK
jgi:phage anti-repressor protein